MTQACPYCGVQNAENAQFCAGCGEQLTDGESTAAAEAATGPTRKIGQCEMIIGFLLPRRCDVPALGTCAKCGRSFCDEHLRMQEQGMICTACEQGLSQPVAMAETASTYDESDLILFSTTSTWDNDTWGDDTWGDDDDTFGDVS